MFKVYSKGCEYALRALTEISLSKPHQKFSMKQICRKAKIPESYTRKIFQSLVQGKFLSAVPGPGGGYALTSHPKKISLLKIILAVDGQDAFDKCIMGLSECNEKKPCPIHNTWKKMKKGVLRELKNKTLEDLIKVRKQRES